MDWIIVGIIGASIAIFAMVDLALRSYPQRIRLIWYPVVILLPLVGPLAYYFMRKSLPIR